MRIIYLLIAIIFLLSNCTDIEPLKSKILPETLEDCKNKSDSVYVIDNFSYNKNGNLKPPCSMSPSYCECMEGRGIIPDECF